MSSIHSFKRNDVEFGIANTQQSRHKCAAVKDLRSFVVDLCRQQPGDDEVNAISAKKSNKRRRLVCNRIGCCRLWMRTPIIIKSDRATEEIFHREESARDCQFEFSYIKSGLDKF